MEKIIRNAMLAFIILATSLGCSLPVIGGGSRIKIQPGDWSGKADQAIFLTSFKVAEDGSSLTLASYSYSCGAGRFIGVIPAKPLNVKINQNGFEVKETNVSFTGKFSDATHIEGTWVVVAHKSGTNNCPAAQGTWKGAPK
ncbi:MAG TPA: hypothetical protein VIO61_01440 [Anaerolineaceae bacterium]